MPPPAPGPCGEGLAATPLPASLSRPQMHTARPGRGPRVLRPPRPPSAMSHMGGPSLRRPNSGLGAVGGWSTQPEGFLRGLGPRGGEEGPGLTEGRGCRGGGAGGGPSQTWSGELLAGGLRAPSAVRDPPRCPPQGPTGPDPRPKNSQEGSILKAMLVFSAPSAPAGRRAAGRHSPHRPSALLVPAPPQGPRQPGAGRSPAHQRPAHLLDVLQRPAVLGLRLLDLQQAAVPLVVLRHAHFLQGDVRCELGRAPQAGTRGPPPSGLRGEAGGPRSP